MSDAIPIPFEERFAARTYTHPDGRTMPYRWLQPEAIEPTRQYPLFIFLHGGGESGTDNRAQLSLGVTEWIGSDNAREQFSCFAMLPQCPQEALWSDWPNNERAGLQPSMQLVLELIAELKLDFPIDPARLYIGGLSLGGYGTYDALAETPERFAAAYIMCAGGVLSAASRFAHVPLWIFHGETDPVVPVDLSRTMVEALKAAGGHPHYTEYPGEGHNCWEKVFQETKLLPWLFAQRRK